MPSRKYYYVVRIPLTVSPKVEIVLILMVVGPISVPTFLVSFISGIHFATVLRECENPDQGIFDNFGIFDKYS